MRGDASRAAVMRDRRAAATGGTTPFPPYFLKSDMLSAVPGSEGAVQLRGGARRPRTRSIVGKRMLRAAHFPGVAKCQMRNSEL